MQTGNKGTIIIKKKKVVSGDGHHGGAWKVAYADFVTAMMAFFLLMWLLNATTEQQRKGLSDYFHPTIAVNRISGGGDGAFNGDSVFTDETLARSGTGADKANQNLSESESESRIQEDKIFTDVQNRLSAFDGESMVADDVLRHIVTRVTDEGLIIEIFDLDEEPLFVAQTSEPTEITHVLTKMIAEAIVFVENDIAISGYVKTEPYVVANRDLWSLSVGRADEMRQLMSSHSIQNEKMRRITGHSDRQPVVEDVLSVRNNRLEIILLRNKI